MFVSVAGMRIEGPTIVDPAIQIILSILLILSNSFLWMHVSIAYGLDL